MVITIILGLTFLLVAVVCIWLHGLWNNAVTLVNVIISALLATNFYEPIAAAIDKSAHSYTYLLDFLILWGLFALSMTILRIVTEFASNDRVAFITWVEWPGRIILAVWIAFIFVSFAAMTIHTAAIPANPGNAYASGPGGLSNFWAGYVRSRSTGVFSNGEANAFDSDGQFFSKYYKRRKNFEAEPEFRVP